MVTMSDYTSTRGHPLKIYKKEIQTKPKRNYFSNRIINTWNEKPTNVVIAPTLISFKTRLNRCWYGHPTNLNLGATSPARGQDQGYLIQMRPPRFKSLP